MSTTQQKTWLVAYDIRKPRRLRRVHRILRREGLAAQYSVFTVEADDNGIQALLLQVQAEIDAGQDDVRAYHLPMNCPVWRLGAQSWPDGIAVAPDHAARLILGTLASAEPAQALPLGEMEEDEA